LQFSPAREEPFQHGIVGIDSSPDAVTGIRILHVTHGGVKLPKTTHHSSIHFVGDVAILLAVEYPELGLCNGLSLLSESVGIPWGQTLQKIPQNLKLY
jgi:hypothetical protein